MVASLQNSSVVGKPSLHIGPYPLGLVTLAFANIGVLVLYFYYDLTLFQLLAVYWWETLWIGLFAALKLITASLIGDPFQNRLVHVSKGSSLLLSTIALVFISGQFLTIFAFVGFFVTFAFHSLSGIDQQELLEQAFGPVIRSSLLFVVGHGLSFIFIFLLGREYQHARIGTLLALPVRRCFAIFAAVGLAFVGALIIPGFANSAGFVLLLVPIKLIWDYFVHLIERKGFRVNH